MIKPLRKKHLQIWNLWAVLLPLGIIAATIARKPMVKDAFAPPQNGKALPVVIAQKQIGKNLLQLRGSKQGSVKQLVWVNREALKVASATVYLSRPGAISIEGATYIGRIETRGNYVFDLPIQSAYHFILYDFIHRQVIDRIEINDHELTRPGASVWFPPTPNSQHQTPNSLS